MLAGLIKRGARGSTYTGAVSTRYADVNNSWLVVRHGDVLRVFNTREEAEHYATQLTTEGVTPLHPRREQRERERRQQAHARASSVLDQAFDTMAQDPGLIAAARERETQAKRDRLRFGRQIFKVGESVMHTDRGSVPWVGLVRTAEYREDDIDGPGWYYGVGWWNVELKQFHEDYLHQDLLRPL